ncbi:hypothetical protein GE09DRAFT_1052510 [Coniochaeta sp. 2T2.1]|nr:hypothetical protein GE09DRAFT_1052510 [Coniochaeta sp. 2T2.1]
MKGKPVDQLVYEYMFPKPRPTDPQNFTAFLTNLLVLEVRQEVQSYYGHLDTPEAKYPGLDYTHPTHRIRLSRWPWHRRLFRAFDGLRLTPNEIAGLTKWEGTKWAKERYEKEQGITIEDTTEQDIAGGSASTRLNPETEEPASGVDETMAEDSDEELVSVADDLHERLSERVALRNASGDLSIALDEEWERWYKNAIETGALPSPDPTPGPDDPAYRPRVMLTAARAGQWDEIPDYLHPVLRSVLEARPPTTTRRGPNPYLAPLTRQRTNRSGRRAPLVAPPPAASREGSDYYVSHGFAQFLRSRSRRDWSDLRLPGGEGEAADAGSLPLGA